MQRNILKGFMFFMAVVLGLGLATMILWNALLPAMFNFPTIGFFQAIGLLLLGRLIFGGLGRSDMHDHAHVHFKDKWRRMSTEERREFMRRRHLFYDKMCRKTGAMPAEDTAPGDVPR